MSVIPYITPVFEVLVGGLTVAVAVIKLRDFWHRGEPTVRTNYFRVEENDRGEDLAVVKFTLSNLSDRPVYVHWGHLEGNEVDNPPHHWGSLSYTEIADQKISAHDIERERIAVKLDDTDFAIGEENTFYLKLLVESPSQESHRETYELAAELGDNENTI